MNRIFIVSDGTGRTAEQALHAALVQFPGAQVEILVRPKVLTKTRARGVVLEAAEAKGFIVHTIVKNAVINVTNKPIEEIATEILAVRGQSGKLKGEEFI